MENKANLNSKEALTIEVFGRVQGVMFRQSVKEFCDKMALTGHVMNREDGSVLIIAQGVRGKLDELLSWIRINPGFSNVEGVAYYCTKFNSDIKDFSILKERSFFADQARSFLNLGKSIIGVNKGKVPVHVAIIPDGNRRWAREQGFDASKGHKIAGEFEHLKVLMDEARRNGVKYISFWGFSTENWNRDKLERDTIFNMLKEMAPKLMAEFKKNNVRFRHIGRKDRLPKEL
ncbi:MAG: undecaprenyl diphosphate synthase family protein, partial [Nanoarchaeota archaeon]